MKAAIYNPYLDTLGGGERYTLSFAKVLADNGYKVDLEWKNQGIKNSLESRFGMDLHNIDVVNDIKKGDGYDLCFWVSDGSIPTLRSRKNILHFQVPFHDVKGTSLINKMKLFRINKIVCNSQFTKNVIDKEYGVNGVVLYPPVPVEQMKPKRKENIILYVGRFSELKQNKGQRVLVEQFKKLYNSGVHDWRLVLAGGTEVGSEDFLEQLEKASLGFPIELIKSPSFKELLDLYGRSKIFWSASGFGVDENKNPEKVEHFGMTVVEAMAAGALPIIFSAGGHKETIKDGDNGFLWENESELINKTKEVMSNSSLLRRMMLKAIESSNKYSYREFESKVKRLL